MVERCVRDAEVAGSNPVAPTTSRIPVHKVRESLAGATSEALMKLLGFFFCLFIVYCLRNCEGVMPVSFRNITIKWLESV